jgi:hypothetical protein
MTTHKFSKENDRELALDELEIVSGGGKATTKTSSGKGNSAQYLQYDLTECFVSGYSASGAP